MGLYCIYILQIADFYSCFNNVWIYNVSLSRYLDFYVFDEFTNFKICDVIIDITAY